MQLREFVEEARKSLNGIYPTEEANALVGVLCTEFLGIQSYTHLVSPELELKKRALEQAAAALERLKLGEPVQYVLGYANFYGRRFIVGPGVLVPRPETEVLCRMAIDAAMMLYRNRSAYGKDAKPVRILDLCTGSGCIAWTLAAEIPTAEVVAVDISDDALKIAEAQPVEIHDGRKPRFFEKDIFDDAGMEGILAPYEPFDLLVSNPPYVRQSERALMHRNVLDYEPSLALFVSDDDSQKFNKKIAEISLKCLNTASVGIVEINDALDDAARRIFSEKGLKSVELMKDVSGRNRFVRYIK